MYYDIVVTNGLSRILYLFSNDN